MDETYMKNAYDKIIACENEIKKAIIGQESLIRQVLLSIFADGNVLLEGVPGLGKTQLVKTIAKVLSIEFSRIQFTPDLMPADVTGTNLIVKKENQNVFQFEKGPIFANLVLADEINRATPKTQSALLEAMQEKTVTVGKETYHLPQPFMVLATQNPIENEGTYPLPEAQLDRFLFKLLVDFPTLEELNQIVKLTVSKGTPDIKPQITGEEIIEIRSAIGEIPIADSVLEYSSKIVMSTHRESEHAKKVTKDYIVTGASPRAAQAMIKTARVRAVMEGRFNVSFEDIKAVALPALRHRIITNFEALSNGITPDEILLQMIEEIPMI